jgi:hypothetical protein
VELILASSAAKIRATFTGPDGEATEPTNPTVTIVRDSDGEEVVSAQAATDEGSGVVSYELEAKDIPTVDLLQASWSAEDASAADTEVGVVGGFLCTLEEISAAVEAAGGAEPDTLTLREKREEAEGKLEDACRVAFRPSYAREMLCGQGKRRLLLGRPRPTAILTATLDGSDIAAELALGKGGTVERESCFPIGSELEITYIHGWPVPPEPITRAAIQLAAAYVQATGGSDGITRFREDDQEIWLSVPGVNGAETGIPDVDQAIRDYRYPVVG